MATLGTYAAGELGGAHSPDVIVDAFGAYCFLAGIPAGSRWRPIGATYWPALGCTRTALLQQVHPLPVSDLKTPIRQRMVAMTPPPPSSMLQVELAASAGRAGSENAHPCQQQLGRAMSTLNVGGRGVKLEAAHVGDGRFKTRHR